MEHTMPLQKKRTNLPLLRHRMSDEERAGFVLAFRYRARKTAVAIRAGKMSLGMAMMSACREIGTDAVVTALEEAKNPEWSFCAIRYASGITRLQRELLVKSLTERWFNQAQWALINMRSLSPEEKDVLNWVMHQR